MRAWIAVTAAVALGCSAETSADAGARSYCECTAPVEMGVVSSPHVEEASGVAASALHAGVFYVHNDAGDSPRFFAVGSAGQDLGTFHLEPATAIDWEDVAAGPCADPSASCVYFGDIGDNSLSRTSYTIYRVAEPESVGVGATLTAESLAIDYPNGSHNAETLLVHPTTGIVSIVTRVSAGASTIYASSGPLLGDATTVLSAVGTVKVPSEADLTGGSVHPSAAGVLLRTSLDAWYFAMAPGQTVADALLGSPCSVPVPIEVQAEAISWRSDGSGYVTIGEGAGPRLIGSSCP